MKVIYGIFNKITGDKYVGSAVNFYKRKKQHILNLEKKDHHSIVLQRAWEKYGKDSFEFIILEKIEKQEDLISREQWWIDNSNSVYNIAKVAGSSLGIKRRPESIEKMRQAHLGEKHPEWRRKLKGIAQGGDNHWTKKKKFSEKSKKKMSETHKKLYQNGYEHPNKKKILQYNLNGNFIKEWDSLVEASKALNINRTGITNCLRRKSKHAGGFIWNYKFDKN